MPNHTHHSQYGSLLIVIIVLLVLGCSNDDLSRPKAYSLIADSREFGRSTDTIPLSSQGFSVGSKQHMWAQDRQGIQLTVYGKEYFESVDSISVKLKESVTFSLLEITGIADAPMPQGAKQVHFQWKYENIPFIPKRYVIEGGTGTAMMRKYDDGWRLEEISLKQSDSEASLSAMEQEEGDVIVCRIEKEIQDAQKRKLEAEQKRINAIIQRFKNNGDGTVTDLRTGLTWIKQPVTDKKWSQLLAECKSKSAGGRVGWHMATRKELETLLVDNGISIIDAPDGRFFGEILKIGRGAFRVADSIDNNYCWSWVAGRGYKTGWQRNQKGFIDSRALCVTCQ
ncbi:MAG: DUF1566 domain-containing protein [Proteobacteria bacterium]|nr:DUF1566 domain-containing protein [Pseudomonadota bacterium]MBU4287752.1 DUF1566 domain-containing protein [Pseudomonadota bacterium]MBU4414336.1 DUF1566 domain-containing protein [Pseudomonadota bacterium]